MFISLIWENLYFLSENYSIQNNENPFKLTNGMLRYNVLICGEKLSKFKIKSTLTGNNSNFFIVISDINVKYFIYIEEIGIFHSMI